MGPHDNLISELRQDSTGKMVTRWVKPHPDAATDSSAIPAPVPGPPYDSVKIRQELVGEVHDIIVLTQHDSDDILERIFQLQSETLRCLIEYNDSDNDSSENIGKWVAYYSHDNRMVRELATYGSAFDPATDSDFIEEAVAMLKTYDELPPMEDYSKADPQLKALIRGLLHVTDTLYSESFDEDPDATDKRIVDPGLRALIFAHPDKADHIAQVIRERSTTDTDLIREVILAEVPVLSEGAL